MEIVVCGIPFGSAGETDALRQVKDHGFTAVQIYTFWKEFEPSPGRFDWSVYDRQVSLIQEAGLKYVPFIIMGPKYAAPAWWLEHGGHVGLRCLEHGKISPVESIWNAAFREEISRVLNAFANHYLPWGVLESVQPGICGDYGESIFPVLGNWPGDYHTHQGFWCGGEDAIASFRQSLKEKYRTIHAVNEAWQARYRTFRQIAPFLRHKAPSRTAYLDMVDWYRQSMTDYVEFWMRECRTNFPDTPVYMCTGGMENPEHGSLFAAQAKAAVRYGGGIRLTNEGNKFYENFLATAHTWSACTFYGGYLGLEPVGPMTEKGVRARVFGSIAYGNRQIFHYYGNVFDEHNRAKPAASALQDYLRYGKEHRPKCSIAFFWPTDQAVLEGEMPRIIQDALTFVRRMHSLAVVSESMILDDALKSASCLLMLNAGTVRRSVLEKIADWVQRDGGILLVNGLVRDVELERVDFFDSLFGILPTSEEAVGHAAYHVHAPHGFERLAAVPPFNGERGWTALAPDVEMLASTKPGPGYSGTRIEKVTNMFRRIHAKGGQAIFYCGPTNFAADPEALFFDPGVFPALLTDVSALVGVRRFELKEGEIAGAEVGGATLILGENEILVQPDPK